MLLESELSAGRVNNAIWITSSNELELRRIDTPYTPLARKTVLIAVSYSGINPADVKHGRHLGMNDYPAGYEFSGHVLEVDLNSTGDFRSGDAVLGHSTPGKGRPIAWGAHQDVLVNSQESGGLHLVPRNMPMQDAACMSVMTQTAADALFNQLGVPMPGCFEGESQFNGTSENQNPKSEHETGGILIWGGATSVGTAAVQLARAAGCNPIITTASPQNHGKLKDLGATDCFDYRDDSVAQQITDAALKSKQPLRYIFDTVVSPGNPSPSSTDLCEGCALQASGKQKPSFAATLPLPMRPQWKMVLPTRNVAFQITLPNGSVRVVEKNMDFQARIDAAFSWTLANYGKEFLIPKVRVVRGGKQAIEAMYAVADGKSSFEKVAIEHPLE